MSISFFSEDVSVGKISKVKLKNWIRFAIQREGYQSGDITFIFCSDEYLLKINKEYLQHDYYTDIITFNYVENKLVSGDIFISIDTVRENAKEFSVSFENELKRVIIHGVLHLIGYDDVDESSQEIMTLKENEYLEEFSIFSNSDI